MGINNTFMQNIYLYILFKNIVKRGVFIILYEGDPQSNDHLDAKTLNTKISQKKNIFLDKRSYLYLST